MTEEALTEDELEFLEIYRDLSERDKRAMLAACADDHLERWGLTPQELLYRRLVDQSVSGSGASADEKEPL